MLGSRDSWKWLISSSIRLRLSLKGAWTQTNGAPLLKRPGFYDQEPVNRDRGIFKTSHYGKPWELAKKTAKFLLCKSWTAFVQQDGCFVCFAKKQRNGLNKFSVPPKPGCTGLKRQGRKSPGAISSLGESYLGPGASDYTVKLLKPETETFNLMRTEILLSSSPNLNASSLGL